MKKTMIFIVLCCASCVEKEHKIVETYDTECVRQCAHSFWQSAFDHEKYEACKNLHKGQRCCVYETTNQCSGIFCPGESWGKGTRGRMAACEKK